MRISQLVTAITIAFSLIFSISGYAEAASFQGTWNTNLGTLKIYQNADKITGTYAGKAGKIQGTVTGNKLTGTYAWKNQKGVFELILNGNNTSFSGRWSRRGASGAWSGKRVGQLAGNGPSPSARPSSQSKTSLDRVDLNSQWKVEDARNGKNQDYHHVPWTFSSKGYVRAGELWRGLWGRSGKYTIKVILMDTKANTDVFELSFFNHGKEFVALKNGKAYRYGKKI